MGSQPLEQWQIDHILKMQQELGLPDTEEVTMNKDLGALSTAVDPNVDPEAETANDAAAGALSAYKNPNVQKAQTAYDALAKEQMDRYTALEKALAEKRYAPSFSERMFQLSAALAQPTTRRGFGGILENITPVLAAQEKAQREGQISRQAALEQLQSNRLAAQMGLAKQDLTTQLAMANLARKGVGSSVTYADSRKGYLPKPGVGGNAPMPEMNQFGYYVISDPRQLIYLPPNTPVVYPGGDQTKPKYTPANPTG